MGFSAAILAEYKSREAVGASPFEWSRKAELACRCSGHTLSTKETMQVRTNPRDKVLHVRLLRAADMSNATEEEQYMGILTFFSSSITGPSVQNVSSTSIDWGGSSCNGAATGDLLFSSRLLCLRAFFLFEGLTSTGISLVPLEYSLVTHSITLTPEPPFFVSFAALMPLGAILEVRCVSQFLLI
jgi:hypothetical protein